MNQHGLRSKIKTVKTLCVDEFFKYLESCLSTIAKENKEVYIYVVIFNLDVLKIDNIFSNNIQDDIISGNLLLTLSEHFSQFISVTREKIDFKHQNVYIRDYSKFSNESFRDDVSIQFWNYTHENMHGLFKDFYSILNLKVL